MRWQEVSYLQHHNAFTLNRELSDGTPLPGRKTQRVVVAKLEEQKALLRP